MNLPEAAALAASWGSYMTAGDPGAVMYSLSGTTGFQDESHRARFVEYVERQIAEVDTALADGDADHDWSQGDAADLRRLLAWARAYTIPPDDLDTFTAAYVECALWCGVEPVTDDPEEIASDRDYDRTIGDLAPATLAAMVEDCREFQEARRADLAEWADDNQAGHDFWLTRNGHGAGFWDRGRGELGERLSAWARAYGSRDLYIGDDGKVYVC